MSKWAPLQFEIKSDSSAGIRIYRLSGALTDSSESYAFLSRVRDDMAADDHAVLLQMEGLGQMTSAGVGVIAAIYTSARNANRLVALAALTRQSEMLLQIVSLNTLISVFKTEGEALGALVAGGWKA
jgi:anti-anti-sigma factor